MNLSPFNKVRTYSYPNNFLNFHRDQYLGLRNLLTKFLYPIGIFRKFHCFWKCLIISTFHIVIFLSKITFPNLAWFLSNHHLLIWWSFTSITLKLSIYASTTFFIEVFRKEKTWILMYYACSNMAEEDTDANKQQTSNLFIFAKCIYSWWE